VSDANDSEKAASEIKLPEPPPVRSIRGTSYIKRKLRGSRAKRENDTPEQQAARSTAMATWWIAIFTIVLACVSIMTLKQINKGGRPWVGINSDVTFDETGLPWVGRKPDPTVYKNTRRVIYHLRNSGSSPALNTQLVVQPIPIPQSGGDEAKIEAMIERSCQIAEERVSKGNGDLILPGGEQTVPYTFGNVEPEQFLFAPGCIVYRDVDGGLHHTRICHAAALFISPPAKILESCKGQSAN
jgi:hypothetical protein